MDKGTGYELDDPDSIPDSARFFFLLHSVHTNFEAHPSFHLMGTGGFFPRG
jgi:hypothetical protein